MDPAKAKAWQRFCDRVLSDTTWPRSLWLAAVEDALAAALGANARLLADYRADVAELLRLEQAARGSYHDQQRIGQLEAQIKRLIELADATISEPDAHRPAGPPARAAEAPRRQPLARPGLGPSLFLGMLLFLAGVAGATAFYEYRMRAEVDQRMARMAGLLEQRVADMRADLDQRLSLADRLNAQMTQLHDELGANVDQLSATMTESVRSMTALSDNAIAEVERRLGAQGDSVTETLTRLRARADALNRGLDDISSDLALFEERVPNLQDDVQHAADGVQKVRTDFDQAAAVVAAVKAGAPQLVAWLAGQRDALGRNLRVQQVDLDALKSRIRDLEGEIGQSRTRLESTNQSLDQGLQQAKQNSAALERAVQDLRATEQQAAQLMAGADAEVEAAHREMRQKVDQILSQVAEKADLAVLRSQDVIRRAEAEVTRNLQTESQQTLDAVGEARKAQLAELAKQTSTTQAELEQTRVGLIASWQRMDQAVAERQGQVLSGLDGYAQTIQARVQELLDALDVKVAGSDG